MSWSGPNSSPGNRGTLNLGRGISNHVRGTLNHGREIPNQGRGTLNQGRELSNQDRGILNQGPGDLKTAGGTFFGSFGCPNLIFLVAVGIASWNLLPDARQEAATIMVVDFVYVLTESLSIRRSVRGDMLIVHNTIIHLDNLTRTMLSTWDKIVF